MAVQMKENIPSGYRKASIQQYTPEQMKIQARGEARVGEGSYLDRLASGGDDEMWNELEAPAMKQFSAQQGQTASRFSQAGTGSRRSSGFQNEMGQQGSDFAQQLQSNRMNLTRQAQQDLQNMSQQLLGNRPFENDLVKKGEPKKNFWQQAAGGIARAGGTAAGASFGGPAGAKAGYEAGNQFASSFGV